MTDVTPIVALDVPDVDRAFALVDALGDQCRFYKVGSELFAAEGPSVVEAIRARGAQVFLDLKFHDIPNTVAGAVRSVAALGVRLLTVHASGGTAMLQAAVDAAGTDCQVLAVTVLTSLDGGALADAWGKPGLDVGTEVLRLAGLAHAAGLHGVVCSGREAGLIRERFGTALATLVPGIRLTGGGTQDQARVVTPRQAADVGARYIVLGRAVTAAKSPRGAMSQVLSDLS
jgi:orotidine-5'-phosphate decarboxylase